MDLYDFDIQASPKLLEMCNWDEIRKIANEIIDETPDMEFYPIKWWRGNREDCPETIKINFVEHKGRLFKVLPYVDEKGIRVMSFDPSRELHGLLEGHHRMHGKHV